MIVMPLWVNLCHGRSLVRLRRNTAVIDFLLADFIAAETSDHRDAMKSFLAVKNNRVLAIRAFCTDDIAPRPAVFRQASAQPFDANWQTFQPLRFDGARWIPYVTKPRFSPLRVLALPLFKMVLMVFLMFLVCVCVR